jgi:uncharacterized Zn finger protein
MNQPDEVPADSTPMLLPEISQALRAQSALSVRSQRGAIGVSWWAQRWLEVYEQGRGRSELEPARRYARRGLIMSLELVPGRISATVQGSQPEPYAVTLTLPVFTDEQWAKLQEAFISQALLPASLLANRLPREIVALGDSLGAYLLPSAELAPVATCTCEEIGPWCKHAGAVCYLVAERLDHDPFLLFQLRGRSRDELMRQLRQTWGVAEMAVDAPAPAALPLELQIEHYYSSLVSPTTLQATASTALAPIDVLERLGVPAFCPASDRGIPQALRSLYDGE